MEAGFLYGRGSNVKEIVFLLEEQSAKALLETIWPRLISPDASVRPRFIVFEGKQDLEKHLTKKLRGYLNQEARFVVIRDQDQNDCHKVKENLTKFCAEAGRTAIVRIACRELEAFYLGDLKAVEIGLDISGLSTMQRSAKFRNPDNLVRPSYELEKVTKSRYQKVAGSRAIGPHLDLESPGSRSFHHLIHTIRSVTRNIEAVWTTQAAVLH